MKHLLLLWLSLTVANVAGAQTIINKSYPIKKGQPLELKFDYPVVKITTWEKNEVAVIAKVNINDGENDDAFTLSDRINNGALQISNKLTDLDKLPHRYTVQEAGKKIVFKTEADFKAYKSKMGVIRSYSNGVDMDVSIEVKVPVNTPTTVKATYGMVQLVNCNTPIVVDAVYGGIDATLNKAQVGQIKATTSYGHIFSNLDLVLTDNTKRDFFTSITAQPGKGPAYDLKSTYGKIYMRKQ
ncbi:hypothetical protein [Mucilaginibacter aquatilis]|uniref:Adhesin domain-containing protein n=1 Tax=Mucilaginibacter aquatilis TaxID=1517760 RepID=A0A6I4IBS3_9SPHI|nr:hypothetical protein [Mucilaginibacter aquatilis]MVN92651.1 hypothetical protein [Mucilaginibacter aquatilis]